MPTGPTGTPPYAAKATRRERDVIAELYRAGQHAGDPREAGAIRDGVALLVELIAARHRRMENGYWDHEQEKGQVE